MQNSLGFGELEGAFFASSLHFRLVVVDPYFNSNHYALEEAITFCFVSSQKFLAGVHTFFLLFRSHLSSIHLRVTATRHGWYGVMDDMVRWTMTDIQHGGHVTHFNPLKTEFLLKSIYKFSPYLTGNTFRLSYKAQPDNAICGNSCCLLWEPYGTHKYTLWEKCRVLVC
jgi:hypothetical protein